MSDTGTSTHRSAGFKEIGVAALLLAAMLAAQILAGHPHAQYHEGYWLDEYFTYLIANDPSWHHAMEILRTGIDGTPPLYHAIVRLAHDLIGGEPIAAYRMCSTLAMWFALLCVYGVLRHGVSSGAAALAVVATWAHPMVARYAFEARSYSFWFAGTAAAAWAIRSTHWSRPVWLFLAAVFTCSVHYLGIVGLYFVLMGEVIVGPGKLSQRLLRILPAILGSAVLLFWLPLMRTQYRGMGATWIEPMHLVAAAHLLEQIFYAPMLMILLIGWGIDRYISKSSTTAALMPPLGGLFALVFIPLFFFVYSIVGEPLLVDRYFILTVLGLSAVVAALMSEIGRGVRRFLLVIFLILSTLIVRWHGSIDAGLTFYENGLAANAERLGNNALLLFPTRHDLFELWFQHPELRGRLAMIDLTGIDLPRDIAFEQRTHRATWKMADLPPIIDIRQMPGVPFQFLGEPSLLQKIGQKIPLEAVDPQWQVYAVKK